MIEPSDDTLRQALEPPQPDVERVVAAALNPKPGLAGTRIRRSALAAGALLVVSVLSYFGSNHPRIASSPADAVAQIGSSVSNFGGVLLVEGPDGRTLIASAGMQLETDEQQTPYRIMISKGTVP